MREWYQRAPGNTDQTRFIGELQESRTDTLLVTVGSTELKLVPLASIVRLERRLARGRRSRMLGGVIGFVGGAVVGTVVMGSANSGVDDYGPETSLIGGAIGAVVGALIGTSIGFPRKGDQWTDVPLTRR